MMMEYLVLKHAALLAVILIHTVIFVAAENGKKEHLKTKLVLPKMDPRNYPSDLIVLSWDSKFSDEVPKCEKVSNEKDIKYILSRTQQKDIEIVRKEEFHDILEKCDEKLSKTRNKRETYSGQQDYPTEDGRQINNGNNQDGTPNPTEEDTTDEDSWNIIFPGTKWCGAGDNAENYDDLGIYADTDKCCRAHDYCNDTLAAGETRNNLTNSSPFTALSCQCDDEFYDCLERVDSVISNKIGNVYFNVLRRQCYKEDYPTTDKCKNYRSFLKITCKEYEENTNAPKVYQWVTARIYKQLPIPGPIAVSLRL